MSAIEAIADGLNERGELVSMPSPVSKKIDQMRTEMEALLEVRVAERDAIMIRHSQELAVVNEDITILSATLKAMGSAQPKPKAKKNPALTRIGKPRRNGTSTGFGITYETTEVAVSAILNDLPEKFTQRQLYKQLDWDQSKGSQAIRFLREIGFLRKAGMSENGRATLWAVMDEGAFERAREDARSASE